MVVVGGGNGGGSWFGRGGDVGDLHNCGKQ